MFKSRLLNNQNTHKHTNVFIFLYVSSAHASYVLNILHTHTHTHTHTQVKLATLKFYEVDGTGKIKRTRRECPAEMCGAGVFMASHPDRHYCGKCGLTYVFNKPE